ncbi:MAG: recombinase zinc beta ribbon domain-containing protein, partial [Cetobacterium somerae]|uniref:zinc ribbon domain-containing protein n=1 Tax=Cetobacterium somerae TaxID=188913 RepID=UPI003F38E6C6
TKTTYLLAGIVKCSCGSAMHGNRRRAKRITSLGLKEKPEYVSYRCGCRKNKSSMVCDNPEIRKEYLEEYVLTELEKIVLNDNVIDELSKKVNEYLSEEEKNIIRIKETFQKELTEIDGRIKNIINAVSMGFASVDLKNELDRLNLKKNELETNLSKLNVEEKKEERITTEDVKIRLKNIKSFILERDYPEIRKFIKDFVKKIVVSKEGIEVTFNPLSSFVGYISEVEMYSYINRKELYEPLKRSMSLKIKKAI